jgi:hypothetical protein
MRLMTSPGIVLFTFTALSLFTSSGRADVTFERQSLKATGQVLHVIARDLDQDGTNELIAIAREGKPSQPRRAISVWKQSKLGFKSAPEFKVMLPERTVGFDVCDVDAAPGAEIVLLTSRGIELLQANGGAYTGEPLHVAKFHPALGFPDVMDAPPLELCQRPRGAASAEIWVPDDDGVRILAVESGSLVEKATLGVRPTARHLIPDEFRGPRARRDYAVLTELAFPKLTNMDVDKDGDDDCYASIEDRVFVFVRENGVLTGKPVNVRNFDLRTEDEWRADKNRLQVFFGDVTGDGLPDAITVKSTGSIADLATQTRIYAGRGREGFDAKPFVERLSSGYAIPEGVIDLDGDGAVEILEPKLDTSAVAIARLVVTGKISMEFRALRARDKKLVEGEEMALLFKFDPGGAGVKGTLPLYGEDIDGDGITDRVDLGIGDRFEVFRGMKGARAFDEDASFEALVPSSRKASWYVPAPKKPASVVVYFPQQKDIGSEILVYSNPKGR